MSKVIPIFRIFDKAKALEFYREWLGFQVDWEHVFEPGMPLYMQVTREDITLHLSEHHGDCSPGGKVFIEYNSVTELHEELEKKPYRFNRPSVEKAFWGALILEVIDPFGNKILFSQRLSE